MQLPSHAYVPGQTARHDPAFFAGFHDSVQAGMTWDELSQTIAWRGGWFFFENGYHWEAHEVLEPVWMATAPNSAERHLVQALIQTANAALKQRMGRPNAVRKLCDIAETHVARCGTVQCEIMAQDLARISNEIGLLRAGNQIDMHYNSIYCIQSPKIAKF